MLCPAVTDEYIAIKMPIQLHLLSLCTYVTGLYTIYWSFGLAPSPVTLQYVYLQHLSTVHTVYSTIVQFHCTLPYVCNIFLCSTIHCNTICKTLIYSTYSVQHYCALSLHLLYLCNRTIPVKLKHQYYYKINSTTS